MYCNKCGAEVRDNSKYCDKCGANLQNIVGKSDKKSQKKIVLLAITLLLILGIIILAVCFLKKEDNEKSQSNGEADVTTKNETELIDEENQNTETGYPSYVLDAAGSYRTDPEGAILSIQAITEDGYVYYDLYWYEAGGFNGIAKIENDVAEIEYDSEYLTARGKLAFSENNIKLELVDVSVDYIVAGDYEFVFYEAFPKCGSYFYDHDDPEDIYLTYYFKEQNIDYSYEYWCNTYVPFVYNGETNLEGYDLFKVNINGKSEIYLGCHCSEASWEDCFAYDIFHIGVNNELQFLRHSDINGTSNNHDELSKEQSVQASQPINYEAPYVAGSFSKIGETYSTFHVEGSGLQYGSGSQLILMYREYALNQNNWVETGSTDYNGYFSKVGVVNDRIVINIQELAQGTTVGEAFDDDMLSVTPLIIYGYNDDNIIAEQMLIWKGDNGYMVGFATANEYLSGSITNEKLKYVISTTDLNYIAGIPAEVLSSNPTY